MSDDTSNGSSKRPTHRAYTVRESKDGKAFFNRIGSSFEHRDREGYDIRLDSLPVDGRITLRTLKDRVEERESNKGQGSQGRSRDYDRDR